MAAPVKKIRTFIESAMAIHDEIDLVLYQVSVSGRPHTIWKSHKRWTIDETVPIIADQAQQTANGNGSFTRFCLRAYEVEDTDRSNPALTSTFGLNPSESSEDESTLSEPATNEGLLAMLMRHNSDLHRQSSGTWGMMFQYLTGIVHTQQDQIERLTKERMNNAATMEELVSKKHERDMEMADREAGNKRKEEMWKNVLALLPVAVNKLSGKELIRQKETEFEMTSAAFIDTIKPKQLDALLEAGIIDKHQLTLLATMLEQATKRMMTVDEKKDATEKAERIATGNMGPLSVLGNLLSLGNSR